MRPALVRVIARRTADGVVEFHDDVPLGRTYRVDLDTRQMIPALNIVQGIRHTKEWVREMNGDGWLPMDLLEILS